MLDDLWRAVRILVAGDGLDAEAVSQRMSVDYDGVPVPVISPEALVLLYLTAGESKRRGRAFDVLESGQASRVTVRQLVQQFALQAVWDEEVAA